MRDKPVVIIAIHVLAISFLAAVCLLLSRFCQKTTSSAAAAPAHTKRGRRRRTVKSTAASSKEPATSPSAERSSGNESILVNNQKVVVHRMTLIPKDLGGTTPDKDTLPVEPTESSCAEDQSLCVVCIENKKTCAFTACFHKCICEECASMLRQTSSSPSYVCPLCRVKSPNIRFVFE